MNKFPFLFLLFFLAACSDTGGETLDASWDGGVDPDVTVPLDASHDAATQLDSQTPDAEVPELNVVFFDVGQGDSTLLQSSRNRAALVDTGRTVENAGRVGDVLWPSAFYYTVLVTSHFDADHMGSASRIVCGPDGAPGVAGVDDNGDGFTDSRVLPGDYGFPGSDDFVFSTVWDRGDYDLPDTTTMEEYLAAFYGARYTPETGEFLNLGMDDLKIEVVTVNGEILGGGFFEPLDENGRSLSVLVSFGDFHLLIAGDLPTEGENILAQALFDRGVVLNVLRAGHHGSNTSTGELILDYLQPEVVVISVGDSQSCGPGFNAYGHPSQDVLDRLAAGSVEMVFQTQQGGARPATGECAPATGEEYPRNYHNLNVIFASDDIFLSTQGSGYTIEAAGFAYSFSE